MPASDSHQSDVRATSLSHRCPRCGGGLESSADQLTCPSCRRRWPDDAVFLPCRLIRMKSPIDRPRTLIAIAASLVLIPMLAIAIGSVAPVAIALVPILHAALLLALKLPVEGSILPARGRIRPVAVFSRRGAERWRRGVRRVQRQWHHMRGPCIRPDRDGVFFDCGGGLRGAIDLPAHDRDRFIRALSTHWTEPFVASTGDGSSNASAFHRADEARVLPDEFRLFRCERCHYPTLHLGTIDTCPECGGTLHPAAALLRCRQTIERTLFVLIAILIFFLMVGMAGEGRGWSAPVAIFSFAALLFGVAMGWRLLDYGRWIIVLQPRTILVGRFKHFQEIPFNLLDECAIDFGTRMDDRSTPTWRIHISRADRPWRFTGPFSAPTTVVHTLRARISRWTYEEASRASEPAPTAEN